ncbi:MAG: sensor histidine kinase, partial [Phycisphaerae bacterium]
ANVPAELVVQRVDGTRVPLWSPLRSALLATWLVVLAAVVGLVFVARGATQLAERRGRFVSAVTHELRTPLTTFRMYSQMLADGMVSSQEAQREYARTLYDESGRLARIVESVLDYARLGRGTSQPQLDESTVGEMLDGLLSGLVSHAAASGMSLELQGLDNVVRQRRLRTDVNRVQRVLLNLVENACKYAKDASDKRVVCVVEVEHRDLRIRVRDFGPGVPVKERAAIFKAFTRGAAHAHGSVPGLGLGLALCRALAEQLGGSLALTGHTGGAEFTLTLPLTT